MKAHDVRHLCVCGHCNEIGDDRDMVRGLHGACYIAQHGESAFVSLPKEETDCVRLSDVGGDVMRKLLDRNHSKVLA